MKPGSQTSRILSVLWDGKEHSVTEIHRRAGTSRLNSRISDLRKQGCVIECRRKPNRKGPSAYVYQLLSTPPGLKAPLDQEEWAHLTEEAERRREEIPRDALHRYRLYALRKGGVLDIIGATPTAEQLGRMIVSKGRDGLLSELCLGVLDTFGTETSTGTWIVNPWDQS